MRARAWLLPGAAGLAQPSTIPEKPMPMQVRSAGCLFSIIASVVLTILLNVMLRACSTGGGW